MNELVSDIGCTARLPTWTNISAQQKLQRRGLEQLGARVHYLGTPGFPPLAIEGTPLRSGVVQVKGDTSSQYLTGLLQAKRDEFTALVEEIRAAGYDPKTLAEARRIPVLQPVSLKEAGVLEEIGRLAPDAIVTAEASSYLKTAWSNTDLLSNSYSFGLVGSNQVQISTSTKSALQGVGIDWLVWVAT